MHKINEYIFKVLYAFNLIVTQMHALKQKNYMANLLLQVIYEFLVSENNAVYFA